MRSSVSLCSARNLWTLSVPLCWQGLSPGVFTVSRNVCHLHLLAFFFTTSFIVHSFHSFTVNQNVVARSCYIDAYRYLSEKDSLLVLHTEVNKHPLPPPPPLSSIAAACKQVKILQSKSKRAFISIWWGPRHRARPLEWSRCQLGNIARP